MQKQSDLAREELLPSPAAKPKGKILWVIAIFLIFIWWQIEEDTPRPSVFVELSGFDPKTENHITLSGMAEVMMQDFFLSEGYRLSDYYQFLYQQPLFDKGFDHHKLVLSRLEGQDYAVHARLSFVTGEAGQDISLVKSDDLWAYQYDQGLRNIEGLAKSLQSNIRSLAELAPHAIPLYPKDKKLWQNYFQARGFYQNANYPITIELYEKILQIQPNFLLAHLHIAFAYEKTGQQEKARLNYLKFLEGNPKLTKLIPDWVLGLE